MIQNGFYLLLLGASRLYSSSRRFRRENHALSSTRVYYRLLFIKLSQRWKNTRLPRYYGHVDCFLPFSKQTYIIAIVVRNHTN